MLESIPKLSFGYFIALHLLMIIASIIFTPLTLFSGVVSTVLFVWLVGSIFNFIGCDVYYPNKCS